MKGFPLSKMLALLGQRHIGWQVAGLLGSLRMKTWKLLCGGRTFVIENN